MQFDQPLFDQPLDPANWTGRIDNTLFTVAPLAVAGDTVVLLPVPEEGDPGPNVVNYFASPPDVQGATHVSAAAFTNFPIA